ncbi:MAG: three-Cys-motif partner protein TcmP [Bacteroidota bacterium]
MSAKINVSDPRVVMLEHSQAKVQLYSKYLSIYLNILGRTSFIKKIYLFDLMCGEGKYSNDMNGSPVVAIENIWNHYNANGQKVPDMEIIFNDNGMSEIQNGKFKIDRVRDECTKLPIPSNVDVIYSKLDYSKIYQSVVDKINNLTQNERALLFLDPYGYKDVKPEHLRLILNGNKSEILLFMPISYLYRFAKKSMQEDFPGGVALQNFLNELFLSNFPNYESISEFIQKLKEQFLCYLGNENYFVSTFEIERDSHNIYCLFFFTASEKGFEKMLEVKWKIDQDRGEGFRFDRTVSLFSQIDNKNYREKLKKFIRDGSRKTNHEIYRFSLGNEFLPKHTNSILKEWQMEDNSFEVTDESGNPMRKGAFYLSDKSKKAFFSFKK